MVHHGELVVRDDVQHIAARAVASDEPALAATREAVDLYRTLATRNPDAFQPDLPMSRTNLGTMLSELGPAQAALAARREAVAPRRTLAPATPTHSSPASP